MSFIGNLFKKNAPRVTAETDGSGPVSSSRTYGSNHGFFFFGVNEEQMAEIENAAFNYSEPDWMDFNTEELTEHGAPAGLFTMWFGGCKAGSKTVAEALAADDLTTFVEQAIDKRCEVYRDLDDFPDLGEELFEIIEREKPFIIDSIAGATKVWAESDVYETENFYGAVVVFGQSSKTFDRDDEESSSINAGANVFVWDCVSKCAESNRIDWYSKVEDPDYYDPRSVNSGENASCNYNAYYCPEVPFGFTYCDQDGQLWLISEVQRKGVVFMTEYEGDSEYTVANSF